MPSKKKNPATEFWIFLAYILPDEPRKRSAMASSLDFLMGTKKPYAYRTVRDRDFFCSAFRKVEHVAEIQRLYLYKDRDKRDAMKSDLKAYFGAKMAVRSWDS